MMPAQFRLLTAVAGHAARPAGERGAAPRAAAVPAPPEPGTVRDLEFLEALRFV